MALWYYWKSAGLLSYRVICAVPIIEAFHVGLHFAAVSLTIPEYDPCRVSAAHKVEQDAEIS